ncbi:helix-turn-helix transcriptional regulator [Nocardia sp. KC 131]|uniref:helix-turn-helix transcriptional regulator n=1 Tax=Nocardia arseniciresistens TaxID=3392119 RepID=UPI00398E33EA
MATRQREQRDLPAPTNGFVGREPEMDAIALSLLGATRLITLTGSGGIGKTRLAAESVRRYQKAKRTSVHWVRLARLAKGADVDAVEAEIAQSVVDMDFSGRSAWDALVEVLTETEGAGRERQTLLVLDNCEHVLDSVGHLITRLLEAVAGLSILATSREAIGWFDEHLVVVPPLSRQQALTLFRLRAELTGNRVLGDDQIATAAAICRHVHNHPLYIRLAAARLIRQPLAVILRELSGSEDDDKRMRWSHGPRVGADERHRGVNDVIAWSYDLCQPKERLLFDRLSVFASGYDTNPEDDDATTSDVGADLEAIETVCADDEEPGHGGQVAGDGAAGIRLMREEIEGLLDRLVDQSLVSAHITPTVTRYSLLESLRIFAWRRLQERSTADVDEPARQTERHRQYYRDKVVFAAAHWFSPADKDLLDWARAAWGNILTAIERSVTTPGQSAVGLEICVGLLALRLPFLKGNFREMRRWTSDALRATRALTPQPIELQTGAMALLAWIALCQGQSEDAERLLEDSVTACIPDQEGMRQWRGTAETDIGLPACVEFAWGAKLLLVGGAADAITVLERAREKFLRDGDDGSAAMSEMLVALAASVLGTRQQAFELVLRFREHATASGALWVTCWSDMAWAITLTKHGDPVEALKVERIALGHQLAFGDQWGQLWSVQFRMWSLAQLILDSIERGGSDRRELVALATETAQLAGGVETLRARLGVNIDELGPFAQETEKAVAVARTALGPTAFAAAERQGSRLRPGANEVQRLAMGTLAIDASATRSGTPPTTSYWGRLTAAEREVAILAAAGWTNTSIAARRGNSFRTTDVQMGMILQKLMITSRADIINFVPRALIGQVRADVAQAQNRDHRRRRS